MFLPNGWRKRMWTFAYVRRHSAVISKAAIIAISLSTSHEKLNKIWPIQGVFLHFFSAFFNSPQQISPRFKLDAQSAFISFSLEPIMCTLNWAALYCAVLIGNFRTTLELITLFCTILVHCFLACSTRVADSVASKTLARWHTSCTKGDQRIKA